MLFYFFDWPESYFEVMMVTRLDLGRTNMDRNSENRLGSAAQRKL